MFSRSKFAGKLAGATRLRKIIFKSQQAAKNQSKRTISTVKGYTKNETQFCCGYSTKNGSYLNKVTLLKRKTLEKQSRTLGSPPLSFTNQKETVQSLWSHITVLPLLENTRKPHKIQHCNTTVLQPSAMIDKPFDSGGGANMRAAMPHTSPVHCGLYPGHNSNVRSTHFCRSFTSQTSLSALLRPFAIQCRTFGTAFSLPISSKLPSSQYFGRASILETRANTIGDRRVTFATKRSNREEQYYSNKGKSSRLKLYYTLKQYIRTPENAETFVSHLKEDEQRLLFDALNTSIGTNNEQQLGTGESRKITRRQLYLVFTHNCIPFIGFGFLDNAIMILAGEYIDHTIGLTLGITTMAAAALGNTISDLAGIGLAGYVEMLFLKLGLPVPALTPEQAEQTSTIFSSNMGKAFGILIGCVIGMFPLLLIEEDKEEDEST